MTRQPSPRQLSLIKGLLFLAALLPFGLLAYRAWQGDLGANPVEFVQRHTGTWTFNLLLLTLCISPLRALTRAHWLLRLRRMLGLFTFFYGTLHFLAFIGFDHGFEPLDIARDILKRPFVTVGFAAFALLIPLAATSNQWSLRHLGGRRWQELHRSVYLIALLACGHYFWLVKASALIYPLLYSLATALLLGWRAGEWMRRHTVAPSMPPGRRVAPAPAGAQPIQFYRQRPK